VNKVNAKHKCIVTPIKEIIVKLNCTSVFKQKCLVAGPWTTSEIQAEKRNNYRQINQCEEILVSECFYVQVTKVSFHLPKECRTSSGTFAGMPPAFALFYSKFGEGPAVCDQN